MNKVENIEEVKEEVVEEFDGVFRFTNATKKDFTVLWNNKEYTYLAETSSPMIIADESLENIQEIRKKFAYKLAVREYQNTVGFKSLNEAGGVHPATYDENVLEPFIEQCLNPLPISSAKVKVLPKEELSLKGSKAVDENTGLNEAFKDSDVPVLGKMSE